jgi:hypothetical protein
MTRILGFLMLCALGCALVFAQAPAQPAQQKGGEAAPKVAPGAVPAGFDGSAYAKARDLPARIVDFTAKPASVKAGQPVTLVWLTENPASVTIDPEPGRVTPRGSRQLTPAATTTYTLTVRGPNDQLLTKAVTVNVTGGSAAAARAAAANKATPRTADGKPDFSGVYGGGGGGGRGARGAGAPAGPVLKAGAEKYRIVRGPEDTGATANCMPLIPPQSWGVPYQFQILQGANYVSIFHEYPGTFRIIPTDGTPHAIDPDPSWLGDSVAHWDGDTLVVDTIGFNEKTELQGYRHSEALHMVERFRRPDIDTIEYELTIEDPNVFEKPWVLTRTFSRRPDLKRIDEFICENNRDYRPLFGTK